MANIPLKSIKFPDLADTYTVPSNAGELPYNKSDTYPDDTVGKALQNIGDSSAPAIIETAQGSIASFDDGADNIPVKDLVAEIVPLQSGSGDPSPSNVRAISGWSECNVSVAKVYANMLDLNNADNGYLYNKFLTSDGSETNFGGYAVTEYIKVSAGDSVTIKPGSADSPSVCFYNASKSFVSGANYGYTNPFTITVPNGAEYMRCSYNYNYDSPYVEVNKATHTISFASAGTVYGGRLDVTSGVLTVDRARTDLGSLGWSFISPANPFPYGYFYASLSGKEPGETNIIADIYKTYVNMQGDIDNGISGSASSNRIFVVNSAYSDADVFKTAMSGKYVVCELATPITYQLTPTEVKTLLKNNNIWADTGDVTVEYVADTKTFIENLVNA